jgi:hypothetical protein
MNTTPQIARRYPAVVQWSDAKLGDRLRHLHRGLSTLADRHCQLLDDLRPQNPEPWTDEDLYPPMSLNPIVIR